MIQKIKTFLFENKSDKQTIIKNTIWLMIAEFFNKGGMFIITIFIARILGPEDFGILSFVMAFVAMFIVLTDFGLTTLMVREVSKDQSKLQEYFINLSLLKIILGVLTFILVYCISFFIGKNDLYITLILVYTGYSIINNFGEFIRAFFRPSEKMEYEALLKIINGLILLGIVGYILFFHGSLLNIVYGFLISAGINLIISLLYIIFKFKFKNISFNKTIFKNSLKSGFYLMGGMFFIAIFSNTDKVMLGMFGFEYELGIYAAINRILGVLGIISGMFILAIMPNLVKNYDIKRMQKLLGILLLLPALSIIIGFLFGKEIIYILYGEEYLVGNSYIIFLISISMFFFNVINSFYYFLLNYIGYEKSIFYITIFNGLLSVILNYYLIPIFYGIGAAVTLLIGEIIMLFMILCVYRKKIFIKT